MPLWDSVHRGLEKASQEAARIAKTQRLRSTIDQLSRQMQQQNDSMVNKTMELFVSGKLTQGELIPMCHVLGELHQQLLQAQNELRQVSSGQNQPPIPGQAGPAQLPPTFTDAGQYTSGGELPATMMAPPPPDYQTSIESTNPADIPPPPPGMDAFTSSEHGMLAMSSAFSGEQQYCAVCHSSVAAGNQFCPNCGSPLQDSALAHQPTTWAGAGAQGYPVEQETIRAEQPGVSAEPQPDASTPLHTSDEKEV